QHDLVAYRYALANGQWCARAHMQHRAILNIAVIANANHVVVGAQYTIEPEADIVTEHHRADHRGVISNPDVIARFQLAISELVDHGFLSGRFFERDISVEHIIEQVKDHKGSQPPDALVIEVVSGNAEPFAVEV